MPQLLDAFADESFHEDTHGGFYVLAAAVLPVHRHDELRKLILQVHGRRSSKLHWYPMERQESTVDTQTEPQA